ncbi:MAG: NAD-dependent epimerase/dehydratase family protein, partial [Gammaproteobacteria bacterium]|nr:NAD-dependent epimerase/dehydratase family protein [Gammaproteobacteria bacterium]
MHILLTGGTGLIGTALSEALTSRGHRITVLTRKRRASLGDGYRFVTQLSECTDKVDIVINLAGAGLA